MGQIFLQVFERTQRRFNTFFLLLLVGFQITASTGSVCLAGGWLPEFGVKPYCERVLTPRPISEAAYTPQNPLNVLVIDGAMPDLEHPIFKDETGNSILEPVNEYVLGSGLPIPNSISAKELAATKTLPGKVTTWWHYLWNYSYLKHLSKHFNLNVWNQVKYYLYGSLVSAGVKAYVTGHTGNDLIPFVFNDFSHHYHFAVNYFMGVIALKHLPPRLLSPRAYKARRLQAHSTHTSGTLALASGENKSALRIYNLDFEKLGITGLTMPNGNLSLLKLLKRLAAKTKSNKMATENLHGYLDVTEKYLENYILLQSSIFKKLIEFINENKIEAVNMSYGASLMQVFQNVQRLLSSIKNISPALKSRMSERFTNMQRNLYHELFKSFPNTAFFIAAGNDNMSLNSSFSLFTDLDEPNVFVAAASQADLELAPFSNYDHDTGANKVDSAGLGVDMYSAIPGGYMGIMSGTSMASPYLAGLYIRLKFRNPNLSVAEALDILKKGTVKSSSVYYQVASGGTSIPILVEAHHLLKEAHNRGLLVGLELAPDIKTTKKINGDAEVIIGNVAGSSHKNNSHSNRHSPEYLKGFLYQMLNSQLQTLLDLYSNLLKTEDKTRQHQAVVAVYTYEKQIKSYIEELNKLLEVLQSEELRTYASESGQVLRGSNYPLNVPQYDITYEKFKNEYLLPKIKTGKKFEVEDIILVGLQLRSGPRMTFEELVDLLGYLDNLYASNQIDEYSLISIAGIVVNFYPEVADKILINGKNIKDWLGEKH